jgi:hypothetical protein
VRERERERNDNTRICVSFHSEACIDLKQSLTLFPIGLIENWSTARFIDTFDSGQLAVIFIGLILYFVMLGFTGTNSQSLSTGSFIITEQLINQIY